MRDLKADLEICNKATRGVWEHKYNPDFSEIYASESKVLVAFVENNPYDAEFIAHAREGWPHAIERAIKAETLVNELRSDSKTDYGELCDYCPSRERCRLQNFGTCMYGDFDQKEQKGRNPGGEEGMNINIDIMDFVSEEEVREAVLDGIRHSVIKTYSGDEENMNRLVSNLSYKFVYQMVDEQFDNKLTETLKAKIAEVIETLTAFSLFRRKDFWESGESVAYQILEDEIVKSRPQIAKQVEKVIKEYKFDEVRDGILDVVFECVMGKLFSGGEKNA